MVLESKYTLPQDVEGTWTVIIHFDQLQIVYPAYIKEDSTLQELKELVIKKVEDIGRNKGLEIRVIKPIGFSFGGKLIKTDGELKTVFDECPLVPNIFVIYV
jgi:hypothetical protein